jgi:hypothetical protein
MSEKTIHIIAEAFKAIPAGNHLVKQDHKKDKRYLKLASYVYHNAIKKNGLHLSSNKEGVAVAYVIDPKKNKKGFSDYLNDIKFAFQVSGLKNALTIVKRQNYIQNMRPKDTPYMYWEFSGVNPHYRGMDTASFSMGELRDKVYNDTHEKQLPMYSETSIRKNMIVYRRYGFDIYHEWKMPDGTTMWFLKYDTLSKENPIKKK